MASPDKSTSHHPIDQALQLLKAISNHRSSDFSGVGVVFYDDLATLPHLQLTGDREEPDASRFADRDLALVLATISTMAGPLHDGFHFVEARSWRLTHLSQFISPPIPHDAAQRFHGTGARLMAAVLASLLPGIVCVGLVSNGGEIHLFSGGVDIAEEN
jgi:hypothetical protein